MALLTPPSPVPNGICQPPNDQPVRLWSPWDPGLASCQGIMARWGLCRPFVCPVPCRLCVQRLLIGVIRGEARGRAAGLSCQAPSGGGGECKPGHSDGPVTDGGGGVQGRSECPVHFGGRRDGEGGAGPPPRPSQPRRCTRWPRGPCGAKSRGGPTTATARRAPAAGPPAARPGPTTRRSRRTPWRCAAGRRRYSTCRRSPTDGRAVTSRTQVRGGRGQGCIGRGGGTPPGRPAYAQPLSP